jgi:hypothetical protein
MKILSILLFFLITSLHAQSPIDQSNTLPKDIIQNAAKVDTALPTDIIDGPQRIIPIEQHSYYRRNGQYVMGYMGYYRIRPQTRVEPNPFIKRPTKVTDPDDYRNRWRKRYK